MSVYMWVWVCCFLLIKLNDVMWHKPYVSFNGVLYLMWLEGTTVDGAIWIDSTTHTHKQNKYSSSLALPKRSISFLDIIICVITYEAIKQTSVPISSPSVSPLFWFCIIPLPCHLFQSLLFKTIFLLLFPLLVPAPVRLQTRFQFQHADCLIADSMHV